MILKTDCKHFYGDRPCKFHKEFGINCSSCIYYEPIDFKILIVKLDAIGDVLRTTSILPPLKIQYPHSHITWCTRKNARELFVGNELVDELLFVEEDAYYRLNVEQFDIIINLDTSKLSSSIATLPKTKNIIGFYLNPKGYVDGTTEAARVWLEMSAFDDIKFANTKTYQSLMYNIIGLECDISLPILALKEDNIYIYEKYRIDKNKLTVGLNTGVGSKWPNKAWPLPNWEKLIMLLRSLNLNLLLLGGPEEKLQNEYLSKKYTDLVYTGCDNNISDFANIVNLCEIIITSDSFALHIGTALKKYIIALFGPTSSQEIELYGKGLKIQSSEGCKCFYNRKCTEPLSCMSKISAEKVYEAITDYIKK